MENDESEPGRPESPRRARRRRNLELLLSENGGAAQVARESGTPKTHFSALVKGKRGLGDELAEKLERLYDKPLGWFDRENVAEDKTLTLGSAPSGNQAGGFGSDVVIPQYHTGGAMGNGIVLRDQPGVINSWRVSSEWVQKNVHNVTSPKNLAIVTGFGDSMKPIYNSGDPLLVDKGVTTVEFDGVYFFRIGNEGYIKRLQRIPGIGLRAISENKAYEPWDITEGMDFEVFARVVKVWRGDDY